MIVKTLEDFQLITKNDDVELVDDIDCRGLEVAGLVNYFSGSFNGNGHKISNLVITKDIWGDEQKIALFKSLSKAQISDIEFENIVFNIDCGLYNPSLAGLAVDVSDSVIKNVKIDVVSTCLDSIPMIYESVGSEIDNVEYTFNNSQGKIYKYKDGNAV